MANETPSPNRNPRRGTQHLSSVTTAIHLMKTFSDQEPEIGISELAKRLKVAKSTVHRLAMALVDEGLLEQSTETGRYRLGMGLFALGSLVRNRLDVATESKAVLHELRTRSGENARLAVFDGRHAVYIHDFESAESVRLRSITGQFRPVHATAEGMILLGELHSAELAEFLARPLEACTINTLTDPEAVIEKVRRAKRAGFAIEDEESELGARCLAAPVVQADGRIIAAVGIAGPRDRLRKRNFPQIAEAVVEAANRISARLGYRPAPPLQARSN